MQLVTTIFVVFLEVSESELGMLKMCIGLRFRADMTSSIAEMACKSKDSPGYLSELQLMH